MFMKANAIALLCSALVWFNNRTRFARERVALLIFCLFVWSSVKSARDRQRKNERNTKRTRMRMRIKMRKRAEYTRRDRKYLNTDLSLSSTLSNSNHLYRYNHPSPLSICYRRFIRACGHSIWFTCLPRCSLFVVVCCG